MKLADGCGLRPRINASGPGYGVRPTEVIIDSRWRGGLFGAIVISPVGELARGHLVRGNWGEKRHYEGVAEVRRSIGVMGRPDATTHPFMSRHVPVQAAPDGPAATGATGTLARTVRPRPGPQRPSP